MCALAPGADPEWLRLLMEMPFVGVAIFSARSLRWLRLNDRFCAIAGYERTDLARSSWREICHPEDRARAGEELRQIVAQHGRHRQFRLRLLRKDGTVAHVEIDATDRRAPRGADRVIFALVKAVEANDSGAILQAVLQQSVVGIYVIENGKFTHVSPRMAEIFGYLPGELAGMTVQELVAGPDRALVSENLRRRGAGEARSLRYEFRGLRKDGSVIDVLVQGSVAEIDGRRAIVGVIEDISASKMNLSALSDSESRFRAVLEQSVAAIYVIQDQRIVYVNPRMREIFGYGADEAFDPDPLAHVQNGDRLKVIEQMRPRLASERKAAYSINAMRRDGTPFVFGVNATVAVYEGRPAIIAVAQDITERVRAESESKRHVERVEQAMRSTIEVVSRIGELRDPYTHGHERRVGELAAAIATEMGLGADAVEGVRVAGYLHDIGKIGVPAELLAKPTRLSPAEFELIKGHAQQGYDILKDVDFPWPVAQIALQHHERLDGTGYPQGLTRDAILPEARVMSVADVVEAMASHRPYRPGLGTDKALAEIERGRGTAYDPVVADACLRLFREKGYRLPA